MTGPLLAAALVGTTLIIVRGTIFGPLQRLWPALFRCAQCAGFWVGVAFALSGVVPDTHGILSVLAVGSASSFGSLLADAILLRLLGDPE